MLDVASRKLSVSLTSEGGVLNLVRKSGVILGPDQVSLEPDRKPAGRKAWAARWATHFSTFRMESPMTEITDGRFIREVFAPLQDATPVGWGSDGSSLVSVEARTSLSASFLKTKGSESLDTWSVSDDHRVLFVCGPEGAEKRPTTPFRAS